MSIDNEFDNLDYRVKKRAVEMLGIRYAVIRVVGFVLILSVVLAGGCPKYKVWKDGLLGQAELKQAEWNRQIIVEEAVAKSEAAEHWAVAEVKRAGGAAEANAILADSLGGSEGYLRWLYIQMMEETKNQIIYIPTEGALPILEAGRR